MRIARNNGLIVAAPGLRPALTPNGCKIHGVREWCLATFAVLLLIKATPCVAGATSAEPQNLTGLFTFGEGGVVRLVIYRSKEPYSMVVFQNLGTEPFTIEPEDRWIAVSGDGSRTELKPRDPENLQRSVDRLELHPHVRATLILKSDRPSNLHTLIYGSSYLEREVMIRDSFQEPSIRLKSSLVYPETTTATAPRVFKIRLLVGKDGCPKSAFPVAQEESEKHDSNFLQKALQAVLAWEYQPATVDGAPQDWLWDEEIRTSPVARAEFTIPLADMLGRLTRFLSDSFAGVIPLPRAGGFVAVEQPRDNEMKVYLLRYGEQDPGVSSWLTATSMGYSQPKSTTSCRCLLQASAEGVPSTVIHRFSTAAGLDPPHFEMLLAYGPSLIPSGLREPESAGAWNGSALRAIFKSQLSREGNALTVAQSSLPTELELLSIPDRSLVTEEGVKPPQLVKKVQPRYPAEAKRQYRFGRVKLEAMIDEQGDVVDLHALSSTHDVFTKAAMEAVCCWKYRPATQGGFPVPVYFSVSVDFELH